MTTTVGSATALAAFLQACSNAGVNPAATPPPTSTPEIDPTSTETTASEPTSTATAVQKGNAAKVALVKTGDRADGVRRALALLGINPVAGKRVFLKPNFNSADPAPGSTHPDVLRALIVSLQAMGASAITIGDRSGMGNTRQVMEKLGVFQLAAETGCETLVFDELGAQDWVMIQPPQGHWTKGFPIARACLDADAVVQACCIKTHRYGGHFTLSLKNSVGLVGKRLPDDSYNFMSELHGSDHQRRMIAEINAAYTPALVVMDGVEAFISGGPDAGERVSPGVMLAGTDRVALDAVGVAILRMFGCRTEAAQGRIFEQEQIARAVELGVGIDSPEKIMLMTEDAAGAEFSEKISDILRMG